MVGVYGFGLRASKELLKQGRSEFTAGATGNALADTVSTNIEMDFDPED